MKKEEYFESSLDFVNELEGYKCKFKNLHWSAPTLSYHKVIDKFLDELTEFQDSIAEISQGYCGKQYAVNEIRGKNYSFNNATQALRDLDDTVLSFEKSIASLEGGSGIMNCVNDFQQDILEYKYLFMLAVKDGESLFVK